MADDVVVPASKPTQRRHVDDDKSAVLHVKRHATQKCRIVVDVLDDIHQERGGVRAEQARLSIMNIVNEELSAAGVRLRERHGIQVAPVHRIAELLLELLPKHAVSTPDLDHATFRTREKMGELAQGLEAPLHPEVMHVGKREPAVAHRNRAWWRENLRRRHAEMFGIGVWLSEKAGPRTGLPSSDLRA